MTTNALLLKITAPGTLDAYMKPADDGATLWSGRATAYLRREREYTGGGSGVTQFTTIDVLYVATNQGVPVTIEAGDSSKGHRIEVFDQRSNTVRNFRVSGVEHRSAGTVADSLKLKLETI